MIATQTQSNLDSFSFDCHDGLAVFHCQHGDSPIREVSLCFGTLAEAENFAAKVQQMAQDYRFHLEDRKDVENLMADYGGMLEPAHTEEILKGGSE